MGGYYVPNIQRPGFGYQRRNEDDEDEFNDPLATVSSSGTLSSDTGAQMPDYLPTGMDWMKSYSAPQQPAQADTAPPDIELSPSQPTPPVDPDAAAMQRLKWQDQLDLGPESVPGLPNVGGTPDPESESPPSPAQTGQSAVEQELAASYPPDATQMPVPDTLVPPPFGGGAQPAGPQRRDWAPPPVSAHPEEDRLKAMIQQGPKRSVLGTIAGMAAKFGAGYVNAASRTRNPVPVPTQTARDWALRAPGGGSWDTKLARQKELVEQEQGEEKRTLAAQQLQAQAEERKAQADYYKQHGTYLGQMATTAAKAEADRQKQQQLQRITQMGGKTPQIRSFPVGNPPAEVANSSDWYVKADPYDPRSMIAVRPNPGDQIDDETAEFLGIPKGSYVQPRDAVGAARAKVAAANAGQASKDKENQLLRQQLADQERARHNREIEGLGAGREADAADARQARLDADREKRDAAINSARDTKLTSAQVWAQNERDKVRSQGSMNPDADEATIAKEWLRRSQSAYDGWGQAIRSRGGSAADFTVYPNGSVAQTTEAYGRGGKPVPIGAAPAPAPAPAPTGGGRGGRGNVPPPVNTGAQTPPAQAAAQTPAAEAAPKAPSQPSQGVSVPIPGKPGKSMLFSSQEEAEQFFKKRGVTVTFKPVVAK